MCNIEMRRQYTISEAAKELGITRNTLYKWIRAGSVPNPKETFVSSIRLRVWNEEQMAKVREYKKKNYWGKGIDRRTGKKAKRSRQ
jgi:transposase-like protein